MGKFRSEWFWYWWKGEKPDPAVQKYVDDNYEPGITYQEFAKDVSFQIDSIIALFDKIG